MKLGMKETYSELKKRQQDETNELPIMFAYSNKQFEEGMIKLGLTASDTDKIYHIGGGGYIKKTDSKAMDECFTRHCVEFDEAIKADTTGEGFIFQALDYELANHEYVITGSVDNTLDALGLTMDDIRGNPAMENGFKLAVREQMKMTA